MAKLKLIFKDRKAFLYLLVFLLGFAIMFYPWISNKWNEHQSDKTISAYEKAVKSTSLTADEEIELARQYNAQLSPKKVPDAFSVKNGLEDKEYESLLNANGDGVMGYIRIPAIEAQIPIYHYTDEESLSKGAGHLLGSTLPVGGEEGHAVISAHRGLPSYKLFRDLDLLEIGDNFYIHIFNEIYKYEVDDIRTVLPDETDSLAREQGKDLVTLVTCTPYGVNTHRLLVRGHRTTPDVETKAPHKKSLKKTLITILCIIDGIVLAYIILWFNDRRREIKEGHKSSGNKDKRSKKRKSKK